jgi:Zn-dependent protease with chaperone function
MSDGKVITAYLLYTIVLSLVLGLPLGFMGYAIGAFIAIVWWIIASPLNGSKYPDITKLITSKMAGPKVGPPSLWIVRNVAPMVITIGYNPTNSHLIFTQGFFERLDDKSQIGLTIRALEDIRNGSVAGNTGIATLLWWILIPGRIGAWISGKQPGDPNILSTILNLFPAFLFGWPFSFFGIDKKRIYALDSGAMRRLDNPDYLPYGLMKLQEAILLGSYDVDLSMSGLCIVNPSSRDPYQNLFKMHPPTPKRIDHLRVRANSDRKKFSH